MAEQVPPSPPGSQAPSSAVAPPSTSANEPKPLPHMGDEFGTAEKNLPPAKIVLIGVGVVVAVALIFALLQRPHSLATGSISNLTAVEVPDQGSVLVAVTLTIHNGGTKPYWIHIIQGDMNAADGSHYSDEAAAAADFDRYFQAFPALKEGSRPALKRETMVPPGTDLEGTVIVSFPVKKDGFEDRKDFSVTIQPYDQPVPLVLTR